MWFFFLFFIPHPCLCDCIWQELLPPPPVGCARIFVHNNLIERKPGNFIILLPHPEQCKIIDMTQHICPDIIIPFYDITDIMNNELDGFQTEPNSPPEFVKLSLFGNTSFTHSVDMLPLGNDFYGFTMIPIEHGIASLAVNVDFADCTGTNMLGKIY